MWFQRSPRRGRIAHAMSLHSNFEITLSLYPWRDWCSGAWRVTEATHRLPGHSPPSLVSGSGRSSAAYSPAGSTQSDLIAVIWDDDDVFTLRKQRTLNLFIVVSSKPRPLIDALCWEEYLWRVWRKQLSTEPSYQPLAVQSSITSFNVSYFRQANSGL